MEMWFGILGANGRRNDPADQGCWTNTDLILDQNLLSPIKDTTRKAIGYIGNMSVAGERVRLNRSLNALQKRKKNHFAHLPDKGSRQRLDPSTHV